MNWDLSKYSSKRIVFIGKGREGISLQSFFAKHSPSTQFSFVDQKDDPNYLENLKSLDLSSTIVIKTAGCPGRLVPVPYTTPTNIFFELAQSAGYTIVGITGTKGKSTTASIISHILNSNGVDNVLCGNIGYPMIDYLDTPSEQKLYVVELGAYMTADLKLSPKIAVIGNLFREHIDYFGSEETYYQAKRNMLVHMQPDDTYIYNPDFSLLQHWADELPCNKRAIKPTAIVEIDLHNTAIIGDHNKLNILLALEVADIFNISKANALSCLSTYKPLAHRLEKVTEIHDVTYIDDAISTTPESTLAALQAVKNIDCLMLGGLDRGYDFTELAAEIAKQSIRSIVLFPDSGETIAALFPPTFSPQILRTSSMKDAVAFASKNARPGSTVLLSCASPSYSLWKDFEAKGDDFKQQVLQLL